MKTPNDYLIANFAMTGAEFDMSWLDDDWTDRRDALDCETVPFDAVESDLAMELHTADVLEGAADARGSICDGCHRDPTWAETDADEDGWRWFGRDLLCPCCQPKRRAFDAQRLRDDALKLYRHW